MEHDTKLGMVRGKTKHTEESNLELLQVIKNIKNDLEDIKANQESLVKEREGHE